MSYVVADNSIFNKEAFPWVETQTRFVENVAYPKVSIVVPSYNQGPYLEETLLSILRQNYPNLELIVIDGGSTDTSVEIIKKYESKIAYWVSEKDRGQSHAINKGFSKATGEWLAWMNSDDCYLEGALHYLFEQIAIDKYDMVLGFCSVGASLSDAEPKIHPSGSRKELKDILRFFYHVKHIIPSQSVFVRRSLMERAGLLDETVHYCMDLEWYARMYLLHPRTMEYPKLISFFRKNDSTKTGSQNDKMQIEAMEIAEKYAPYLDDGEKSALLATLHYHRRFIFSKLYRQKNRLSTLLNIWASYPLVASFDRRFWGSVKNSLT